MAAASPISSAMFIVPASNFHGGALNVDRSG